MPHENYPRLNGYELLATLHFFRHGEIQMPNTIASVQVAFVGVCLQVALGNLDFDFRRVARLVERKQITLVHIQSPANIRNS